MFATVVFEELHIGIVYILKMYVMMRYEPSPTDAVKFILFTGISRLFSNNRSINSGVTPAAFKSKPS